MQISITNDKNPFWILHAVVLEVKNGVTIYQMVSNTITEQYVKLGPSTILVVWTDLNTGLTLNGSYVLNIMTAEDYEEFGIV